MTYKNTSTTRLLKLVFQDKDEIHLRPGEQIKLDRKYKVTYKTFV